jgi:hypothetical protein
MAMLELQDLEATREMCVSQGQGTMQSPVGQRTPAPSPRGKCYKNGHTKITALEEDSPRFTKKLSPHLIGVTFLFADFTPPTYLPSRTSNRHSAVVPLPTLKSQKNLYFVLSTLCWDWTQFYQVTVFCKACRHKQFHAYFKFSGEQTVCTWEWAWHTDNWPFIRTNSMPGEQVRITKGNFYFCYCCCWDRVLLWQPGLPHTINSPVSLWNAGITGVSFTIFQNKFILQRGW